MILIEAINSFVIIFLFSEIFVIKNSVKSILKKKYNVIILSVTVALNIFLSSWLPIQSMVATIVTAIQYPFYYIFKNIFGVRMSVTIFSFFASFVIQYIYEINRKIDENNNNNESKYLYYGKKLYKPFLSSVMFFVAMSIHDHKGGDAYLTFIFNFCIICLIFSVGAYYDVRREISSLSIEIFLSTVWDGIKWLLPVFPFLMVLFSTLFFIIVCIFEVFHMNKYEHYLNYPIYHGTLYGPTAFLYVYVKKKLLMSEKGLIF